MSFDYYYGFVTWWVYVKVNLEYFYVMPFMATCGLWDLRCYVEKLCDDVILSMLRVVMVAWSPFGMIVYSMVVCNDSIMLMS